MEKLEHGIALSSAGAKTAELIGLAIAPVIISMLSLGGVVALSAVPLSAFIIGIISKFISIKNLFMLFGIVVVILFVIQNFSKVMKKYNEY